MSDGINKSEIETFLKYLKVLWQDIENKDTIKRQIPDKINGKTNYVGRNFIEYLDGAGIAKPESLLSDKLMSTILSYLNITNFREVKPPGGTGGWIDYILTSSGANPVGLELKALHNSAGQLQSLDTTFNLLKNDPRNQIIRYLKGSDTSISGVEYVVLTNMKDVFYFSKEAIKNFNYFKRDTFDNFIHNLIEEGDIWNLVRSEEDNIPKRDLDKIFLSDLRTWVNNLSENVEWNNKPLPTVIHLINKLIFVRTLEDHALVSFNRLSDEYREIVSKWSIKGDKAVIENFFCEIDRWFYEFYDTSLFKTSIAKELKNTQENYKKFRNILEEVMGYNELGELFQNGLSSYNFRKIDEDVLGKSYEAYLAENRKDSGIYYTNAKITKYMAENLANLLFEDIKKQIIEIIKNGKNEEDFQNAYLLANTMIDIKILDPACGSGSFLVKVLKNIHKTYDEIANSAIWIYNLYNNGVVIPEDLEFRQTRIKKILEVLGISDDYRVTSLIILRHIYGIDLDDTAIEVAKLNIWKEALILNKKAFRYTNLPKDKNHVLPDLSMNIIALNSIYCLPDDIIMDKLKSYKNDIKTLWAIRNDYLKNPLEPEILSEFVSIKNSLISNINQEDDEKLSYIPIHFFFAYFDKNGEKLDKYGFDGIITNPPWNNIKPVHKEFASKHSEIFGEVTKFNVEGKEFEKDFKEKIKDPKIKELYKQYENEIKNLSDFIKRRYRYHGNGDLSMQKVFLERSLELSKGFLSILIPSGFHTDEGSKELRSEIFKNNCLKQLISFENRGKKWFVDVHAQFKFDMLFISKEKCDGSFRSRFYANDFDPEEPLKETFEYPLELINKISPLVNGVIEFRGPRDIEIVNKIRGTWKLFYEYGYEISSEFHMTNNNDIFTDNPNGWQLYEGKMIYQFDPFFEKARYYVDVNTGKSRLLKKYLSRQSRVYKMINSINASLSSEDLSKDIETKFNSGEFKFDCDVPRLAYRSVAGSTNERTFISCIIPEENFLGNSLNYIIPCTYSFNGKIKQKIMDINDELYLMAIFNSFVMDYYIRMRVSSNLNEFFIKELPVPESDEKFKIIELSKKLLYRKGLFKDLENQGLTEIKDEKDILELRSDLEVLIAKTFSLSLHDMEHILKTFKYGNIDKNLINKILEKMGDFND